MTFSEACDKLIKDFADAYGLDYDTEWPDDLWAVYVQKVKELQISYGRTPL